MALSSDVTGFTPVTRLGPGIGLLGGSVAAAYRMPLISPLLHSHISATSGSPPLRNASASRPRRALHIASSSTQFCALFTPIAPSACTKASTGSSPRSNHSPWSRHPTPLSRYPDPGPALPGQWCLAALGGPVRAGHRGTVATRYPCPRWRAPRRRLATERPVYCHVG